MPGEGKLDLRCEDANAHVGVLGRRRQDEDGLRQVHLPGDRLHRRLVDVAAVGEHRQLVPGQRRVREDVDEHVAEPGHEENLPVATCAETTA